MADTFDKPEGLEIDESLKGAVQCLVQIFDKEDEAVRQRQVRSYKRQKYMWDGFTRIWYSEVAHDWRVWDEQTFADSDLNQQYYDKPVNVYRAYLESIIAALSVTVPAVKCFPDDAENPLDLSTAEAGDKIGKLIYRHNNAVLLWLKSLFTFYTEGMVACYAYPKSDESYGTYSVNKKSTEYGEGYVCPGCGEQVPDQIFTNLAKNEFQPDDDDIELHNLIINDDEILCPNCAAALDPNLQKSQLIVERIVGSTLYPKTRICLEVYGGLTVKVANYARCQADTPYLIQGYETHYSYAIDRYPHLRNSHGGSSKLSPSAMTGVDQYDQWARLNTLYRGEYPMDTVTVRNVWIRPSAYNTLKEEYVDELKKKFPDGLKIVMVGDELAEVCNESLDDCWTLLFNPLTDYLTFEPAGAQLISIQDITNDLVSLVLQTIEHGVSQTFVDPAVLNFSAYSQTEIAPGSIYPVTPKPGKSLQESFFELKTANLSPEILPFFQKIQELGQLISGALPSLFGGQVEGSRTASEYSMSRAQALQRQQNTWKIFTTWWKDIFSKVIPMYIQEMQVDEHEVFQNDQGDFFNVYLRKAEMEGKIGKIELEASETLPITWTQQKETIMQLLENANPEIARAITDPENIEVLHEAIGIPDFNIPGYDDRVKQLEEIRILQATAPTPTGIDPMSGQLQFETSVPVEPLVDDHAVQAATCRRFLVSEAGRQLRETNKMGYQNILLHMQAHMQLMAPINPSPQPTNNGNPAAPKGDATPLAEKENVQTEA